MGKRNTKWNLKTLNRFIKEGRGTGDGANYFPWITTHDFASEGKVVRIWGYTTARIHHLMSQLEKWFFLTLDYDPNVTDIKEQFPLPMMETQLIASKHGIKHPEKDGWPFVMTTDFYYCKNGIWYAVAIKPSEMLQDERVLEKLDIERTYWESHNVSWQVITEKEINRDLADNIFWLRSGESFEELVPSESMRRSLKSVFMELYANLSLPFEMIVSIMESEANLKSGTVIQLFKELIWERQIEIDLTNPINIREPRTLPCHDFVMGGFYG